MLSLEITVLVDVVLSCEVIGELVVMGMHSLDMLGILIDVILFVQVVGIFDNVVVCFL